MNFRTVFDQFFASAAHGQTVTKTIRNARSSATYKHGKVSFEILPLIATSNAMYFKRRDRRLVSILRRCGFQVCSALLLRLDTGACVRSLTNVCVAEPS
jgi:hypothetical protein